MTCFDAQVIRRMTAYVLDGCGRIQDTGNAAIYNLQDSMLTIGRARNVTAATRNTLKLVTGATCSKPAGCPTDDGFTWTLTFCGNNPAFKAATGYMTLDTDGDDIIGWEDAVVTCGAKIALEIIFEPVTNACVAGAEEQCQALLIPSIEGWLLSGDETYNGETVPDMIMTGTTALNALLFDNYAVDSLPDELEHWVDKFADIETGRSWSYSRLVDCPTVDDTLDPCLLVPVLQTIS